MVWEDYFKDKCVLSLSHYLELFRIEEFEGRGSLSVNEVARNFKINPLRASSSLRRLHLLGYLKKVQGSFGKEYTLTKKSKNFLRKKGLHSFLDERNHYLKKSISGSRRRCKHKKNFIYYV